MKILHISIITLILISVSCATKLPPPTEFDKAPLLGMIYDADGAPVHNAVIKVDKQSGPTSDINGRFLLPDLERGDHRILVNKDGYEPTETVFPFLNKSQILYLRMFTPAQLLEEAKTHLESKNYVKSLKLVDRAITVDNQYYPAYFMKAVIFYSEGEYKPAIEILDTLLNTGINAEEINALKNKCTEALSRE